MRQRAISAAVLVPVLLVVLSFGGVVLAAAVALITVLAAHRSLQAPQGRRLHAVRVARDGPRRSSSCSMPHSPNVLEGSGLLLVAVGIVLAAVASFTRIDPKDGLAGLDDDRLRRALRLAAVVHHPARPIGAGRAGRCAARTRSAASAAGSCCWCFAVWSYDTGAYLVGKNFGRTKFLTHISPSKTIEGLVGGVIATTVVVAVLLWGLGQNPLHALALGPLTALGGPVRRPRRIGHQAGGRRQGFGDAHPGPRRDARPGRLRSCSRRRSSRCMSLPSSARDERAGERPPRRVALLGSTGSIGRQTVDVLAAQPDAFRVVALATGLQRCASGRAGRAAPTRRRGAGRRSAAAGLDLPGGTRLVGGADALEALATRDDVDLVIVATGGVVSLRPVLAALRAGKVVATANKETLVAGGHLVMPLARRLARRRRRGTTPRPVREPAGLAPADRLGALGDLAVPRRRGRWPASRRSS